VTDVSPGMAATSDIALCVRSVNAGLGGMRTTAHIVRTIRVRRYVYFMQMQHLPKKLLMRSKKLVESRQTFFISTIGNSVCRYHKQIVAEYVVLSPNIWTGAIIPYLCVLTSLMHSCYYI
jgi:hypothetical protein